MAKKAKAKRAKSRVQWKSVPLDPLGEDRRAEAVTVAWMLAMLATSAGGILSFLAFLVMPRLAEQADQPGMALLLPRLLLFISAFCGAACVSLTPFVYRFRRVPPPPAITIFGMAVSILPALVLFWLAAS